MTVDLGDHINKAIDQYKSGHSKLNEKALSMEGMLGKGARNLLNLLADYEGCRYMQVGTWKGACLYSALYKNNLDYAFACDDFSQYSAGFGTTVEQDGKIVTKMNLDMDVMLQFMRPESHGETLEFEFYNGDCFGMPLDKVEKPINMYFYDGNHRLGDHFLSLYYFYPVLAKDFIFICDDWQESEVQDGTMAAIESCNYIINEQHIHENLFIAHVSKDAWFSRNLELSRILNKPTQKCKIDIKGIHKENIR